MSCLISNLSRLFLLFSLVLIFHVSHLSCYSLSLYSVVSSFFRLWRPHSPLPGQLNTETSASPQVPHGCGLGSRKQYLQVCSVGTWNFLDLFSEKPVRKRQSESPNWRLDSEGSTTCLPRGWASGPALGLWAKRYRPHNTPLAYPMGYQATYEWRRLCSK